MKKAAFILVLCCLLWGYSFPVMKIVMSAIRERYWSGAPAVHAQEVGLSGAFLGWRFGLAALTTLLLLPATWRGYSRDELRGGAVLGAIFAAGMLCQISGLQYTLPSVSSLLTGLTVIFTPLAQALIFRRHVSAWTWLGVALGIAGAAVFSLPNEAACSDCMLPEKPPIPYLGELLTIVSAVFFTGQILFLDHVGPRCNSMRLTLVNFVTTCVLCSLIGATLCGRALYRQEVFGALMTDGKFIFYLVSLTLMCSVAAVHLMNRYQHEVSPAVASVIYSSESIFATGFSLLFRTERLTLTTAIGGALILGALAAVTLPGSAKRE